MLVEEACAGSLFGMSIAQQYIAAGNAKRVLVVGVELLTRLIDWDDRNTCVLFGDGAGAMILGPSTDPDRGVLSTHLLHQHYIATQPTSKPVDLRTLVERNPEP